MSKELSKQELKELKKKIFTALDLNRWKLLTKFPFIGNLLLRMQLVPCRDIRVRTACTDGKKIFFDIDFYSRLNDKERMFVLAHEVWHCVLLHLIRCGSRIPELWNIASDMEVNYALKSQAEIVTDVIASGKSIPIFAAPSDVLYPPKELEGKSAEVIYDYLQKQQKNKSGFVNGSVNDNGNSNRNGSGNGSGNDNGSKSGNLEGQFDNHGLKDSSENDTEEIVDQWGKVGIDEDVNFKIPDDFAESMKEAITSEIQRCQRTQGKLPLGLDGILDKLYKPEIRWQEVLAQFVTSTFNGKRRWLPPARRHVYNELYLQSRRNEKLKATVAIDTSGSCISDLPKFFSELINLLKTFNDYELNLIMCDAKVNSFETYDISNPYPIENIEHINWRGGGGTSFEPPFEYVAKHNIQQDCFLYLTDGYGTAPKNPPSYPVLWILTNDGNENFCSWGRKLRFKTSSNNYS